MASLVAPGGCLYLAEFHPFTHVFGDDDLSVEYPYFHEPDRPFEFPNTGDYAEPRRRHRGAAGLSSGITASAR